MFMSKKQRSVVVIEFFYEVKCMFYSFWHYLCSQRFLRLSWPVTEHFRCFGLGSWSTFLMRVNLTFLLPAFYPVDAVHDGHDSPDLSSQNDVCHQSGNQSYQGEPGRKIGKGRGLNSLWWIIWILFKEFVLIMFLLFWVCGDSFI